MPSSPADALSDFSAISRAWFTGAFPGPTPAQAGAWRAIASGDHALVVAPTGSGKTLAAFFWALDRLATEPVPEPAMRCRVLYVSPLKALAADIERNLRAPLAGMRAAAPGAGPAPIDDVRVGMRTGDTPASERRTMATRPPDVLITTPESLFLMLTSSARQGLRGVETVIVDEIHVLAGTKRGAHLALSLERLDELLARPAQRIGLSATVRPASEVATFLAGHRERADGGREVRVIEPGQGPQVEIDIAVPVPDLADLSDVWAGSPPAGGTLPAAGAGDGAGPAGAPPSSGATRARASAAVPARASAAVPDLTGDAAGARRTEPGSIWPHVTSRLVDLITAHTSTIVFANSRRGAERLTARINEEAAARAGAEAVDPGGAWGAQVPGQSGTGVPVAPAHVLARAHHGSMSRSERTAIETALKAGELPAVVATSSLELGIDMGSVDLVVQVGAPPSVASTLQRIGRAGHQVGEASRGVVIPTHRGELLASAATCVRARAGLIEHSRPLHNPLDVLAQHIVAITALDPISMTDLGRLVRRSQPFHSLSDAALVAVVDMLAGRYPSEEFAELRPRIVWDRVTDTLTGRPGALRLAVTSGGTIPDRGLYGVYLASEGAAAARGGKRVGELDEEMVYESRAGDTFTLGSSTWRIEEITPDRVLVSPAPGLPGRLPFWRGDSPARPAELGEALGRSLRELEAADLDPAVVADWGLDAWARQNLLAYLREQRSAVSRLATDETIVLERFRDELGDWRLVLHSPWGAAVHAPWAIVLASRLRERFGDVAAMHTDDGIVLRLPDMTDPFDPLERSGQGEHGAGGVELEDLLLEPEEVHGLVVAALAGSAHFSARFREAAARALLLPRRRPDRRQPLWQQRQRAAQLLTVASAYPEFPVMLEAVRECLNDDFDVPALVDLMRAIAQRRVRIVDVSTPAPSPFAKSLLFGYVGEFVYDGDAPLAERRAAALTLDPGLLSDLIGEGFGSIAELLDPAAIASVEAEVGLRTPAWRIGSAEQLVDVLRLAGPLMETDLADRAEETSAMPALLHELETARRVLRVRVAGREAWAVIEDAGRLRDALGVALPPGVPEPFTRPNPDALGELVRRYARTHGPFRAGEVAAAYGIGVSAVGAALTQLVGAGTVTSGELRPPEAFTPEQARLPGPDYCDVDVLRRIRRRSLAALRADIEPVPPETLGAFLPDWHQVGRLRGVDGVAAAVEGLAGTPVAASALETLVLPARVSDYRPEFLDELTTSGEVVWVGAGASASGRDGWVALLPADAVAELAPDRIPEEELSETARRVLELFTAGPRGAGRFHREIAAEIAARAVPAAAAGSITDTNADSIIDSVIETPAPPADRQPTDTASGMPTSEELADAVWELAWAGHLTNDSLAPLRSRLGGAGRRARPGRARSGLRAQRARQAYRPAGAAAAASPHLAGRWSLVPGPAEATHRIVGRSLALADRDGVVVRGSVPEGLPGGFSSVYRVLAQTEETGQLRRGYFVEGLGAAQFALPEAVEQLRTAATPAPGEPAGLVLAATDPAQPYGAAIAWPPGGPDGGHRPGRKLGAVVVLVDGPLVFYLERGGRSLLSFDDVPQRLAVAAEALAGAVRSGAIGRLTIASIDGEPALAGGAVAETLRRAGFGPHPQGLRLRGVE